MSINEKTPSNDELRKNNAENAEKITNNAREEFINDFEVKATEESKKTVKNLDFLLTKHENSRIKEYYIVNNNGIYFCIDDKESQICVKSDLVGYCALKSFKVINDLSNTVKEPLYSVSYQNTFTEELKTLEIMKKDELIKYIKNDCFFLNLKDVEFIFTKIILEYEDRIEKEKKVLLEGFFCNLNCLENWLRMITVNMSY